MYIEKKHIEIRFNQNYCQFLEGVTELNPVRVQQSGIAFGNSC